MIGCHSDVTAKIRAVANNSLLSTHGTIHREHLLAKKLSPKLNDVMKGAVKIVNDIHAQKKWLK